MHKHIEVHNVSPQITFFLHLFIFGHYSDILWKVCVQVGYNTCELHFKLVKSVAKYLQLKKVVGSHDAEDHLSRHPELFCSVTRHGFW